MRVWKPFAGVLAAFILCSPALDAQKAALTPVMGWNSWDSFGLTVTEAEFLANANWMAAHLQKFGWQYAVVDEGWYIPNPQAKPANFQFNLDTAGRYIPVENRFPSTAGAAGFGPLSAKVHASGLKFGIHIIRGIPRQAVSKQLRIADSDFSAAEAADRGDTCPWNADNYGVKNNAAGQAYYDSLAKLYASWGVDFIKIDCIAAHPYKPDEIRMVSEAIRKSGRKMVLSLSPGPTPIEKASEVSNWADMWRISDDMWDVWKTDSGKQFPQDLIGQFQKTAAWAEHVGNGWPDADMLPIGHLGPRPGNGKDRDSSFSRDEEKTVMSLWCIFRSPLIMGGNLTLMDEFTTALLTNAEVLAVNQHSSEGKQVIAGENAIVWRALAGKGAYYLAVFNLGEESRTLSWSWKQVGLTAGAYVMRDLWLRKDLGAAEKLSVKVEPHGTVLLRVQAR